MTFLLFGLEKYMRYMYSIFYVCAVRVLEKEYSFMLAMVHIYIYNFIPNIHCLRLFIIISAIFSVLNFFILYIT